MNNRRADISELSNGVVLLNYNSALDDETRDAYFNEICHRLYIWDYYIPENNIVPPRVVIDIFKRHLKEEFKTRFNLDKYKNINHFDEDLFKL